MQVFVGIAVAMAAVLLFWPVRMRIGFSCAMDAFALRICVGPFVLYRVDLPELAVSNGTVAKTSPVETQAARSKDTGGQMSTDSTAHTTVRKSAQTPESTSTHASADTASADATYAAQSTRQDSVKKPTESSDNGFERRLLQVLLTPGMESQLLKTTLSSGRRFLRIFQLRIQDLEVDGSFASPYWNGIWVGLVGAAANLLPGLEKARFIPDWEGREGWRCKGVLRFSLNGWRILTFLILTLASIAWLTWSVWRRYRRTLSDPSARELPEARRWILSKIMPPHEKG